MKIFFPPRDGGSYPANGHAKRGKMPNPREFPWRKSVLRNLLFKRNLKMIQIPYLENTVEICQMLDMNVFGKPHIFVGVLIFVINIFFKTLKL